MRTINTTKAKANKAKATITDIINVPAIIEQPASEAVTSEAKKPVIKLAQNAQSNGQFSHVLLLVPNAGSGKIAASAPFKPISADVAKAGKQTNKTARVEAYLALYTALAGANGELPSYGDKSVLATLIAYGDIATTEAGGFRLINRSPKKPGDTFAFNNDFTATLTPNSNVA